MKRGIVRIGRIPGVRELKEHLKSGVIPLKFCYLGEGAGKWDAYRGHNEDFAEIGEREFVTFMRVLPRIPVSREPRNIIHIGVGNGVELQAIAAAFDFRKDAYFGVDISRALIEKASAYRSDTLGRMGEITFFVSDLEKEGNLERVCRIARKKGNMHNLLLIAGNGTLLSNPNFFAALKNSLGREDFVLITLEGFEAAKRRVMESMYDTPLVREVLKVGLSMAGIGGGKFLPAAYDNGTETLQVRFRTTAGREIVLLESYKPSSARRFRKRLESGGLKPVFIDCFPEDLMYAALCVASEK